MASKKADRKVTPATPEEQGSWNFIETKIAEAVGKGGWMIAVFRYDGEQIHLDRSSYNFPLGDFLTAARLLADDLKRDLIEHIEKEFANALRSKAEDDQSS